MKTENIEKIEMLRELIFLDKENLIKLILQQQDEINFYKKILEENGVNYE